MPEWFDVAKDDQGTISLKVPPSAEHYVAEQMRRSDCQGVTVYTGLLILQTRLAALESICGHSEFPVRSGRRPASSANRDQTHGAVWTVAASAGGPTHATTRSCCPTGKSKKRSAGPDCWPRRA